MLIVAIFSYLCSIEIDACEKRKVNNFFAGLFHDLAEVLTRDIITPVKYSIEGLNEIIKDYEKDEIDKTLLPLLPQGWHDEIRYFIEARLSVSYGIKSPHLIRSIDEISGKLKTMQIANIDFGRIAEEFLSAL